MGFQRLFVNASEGLGKLLPIIGTLYSVLYAFATYAILGKLHRGGKPDSERIRGTVRGADHEVRNSELENTWAARGGQT